VIRRHFRVGFAGWSLCAAVDCSVGGTGLSNALARRFCRWRRLIPARYWPRAMMKAWVLGAIGRLSEEERMATTLFYISAYS
jgi:hypothetical protein